ncbi:leucine-rich repeat extensin-like protein 5 isoform X2 [Carcharodon carcharias]|nr:leucine-rich repeat extensin-like protein 5 isoform X2 [Carcharodon carcharias]
MTGVPSSTPKLKQWMIQQVDSEKYPGLVWEDRKLGMFRIPWKHANHQDYRHDKDAAIFEAWAKFKGAYKDRHRLNPRTWKSRLRCALHKSSDFQEVPHRSQLNTFEPYKVYQIVEDSTEKKSPPSTVHLITVKVQGCETVGSKDPLHSSPSSPLGTTEKAVSDSAVPVSQQAGSDVPSIDSQQMGSDSGCDPSSGCEMSAQEEGSGETTPLEGSLTPSTEESLPLAGPLSTVKVEGLECVGMEITQPSSPSGELGMTEKQVKSEDPSIDSQQMESDSGCDPSSGCEMSAQEEGSGETTPLEGSLTPSTEEKSPSPIPLSSVKVESSESVGTERSQPSSPSPQLETTEQQANNDGPAVDAQQVEGDCSSQPSFGPEVPAVPEEGSGESALPEWSLTPSTEVTRPYTTSIDSPVPPNLPEKSDTSLMLMNNYTFNIGNLTPASLPETAAANVYTININSPAPPSLPEKVLNNYTINISNPTPPSLLEKVPNNYTININNPTPPSLLQQAPNNYTININSSPTPPSLPGKVPNNYTININDSPTPPSLPEQVVNNYTININKPTLPSLPEKDVPSPP